jgi:hypothetical protein
MARKTGIKNVGQRGEVVKISFEVSPALRAEWAQAAYGAGLAQSVYFERMFRAYRSVASSTTEAADLAAEEHDANTARAGAQ